MSEFSTEWLREIIAERFVGGREGFDRWLAKRDAEVAAKAWDELAEYVAYAKDSAEGEYLKSQNPYRKAVQGE